jgi:hypothetical protein
LFITKGSAPKNTTEYIVLVEYMFPVNLVLAPYIS